MRKLALIPARIGRHADAVTAAPVVITLLLLAALFVPLAGPSAEAGPAPQAANVLRVGYLGADNSDAANGAQLAVDQINGAGGFTGADGTVYQFELITLATAPTAASLADDIAALTAQGVVALLGPDSNAPLNEPNFVALTSAGVPVLTGATSNTLTSTDTADVIFRIRAPERIYSRALADYLTGDLALTSFALVQTTVEATEAVFDFESYLEALGIQVGARVQLPDSTGLSAEVPDLIEVNPEAVIVWGPPQDAATLLRKLRAGDWAGIFVYGPAAEAARAGVLPGDMLEGVIGVGAWSYAYTSRASRVFLNDYILAFGEVPGSLSAAAYDAIWVLRAAIVAQGPDAISAGILGYGPQAIVQGALRPAAFGDGDIARTAMVYRLTGGGGAVVVARYDDGERAPLEDSGP